MAGPDVGGALASNIVRFHEYYPDIRVEVVEGPAESDRLEARGSESFAARDGAFDVLYTDVAWIPHFAARGWLRPLDGWFTRRMQSKFLPGDIAGSRYGGKIYRVPNQSDAGLLYYRKDLLDAAGLRPPRTWGELVAQAQRLQRPPELWGLAFQGKAYEGLVCDFLELAWGNGGGMLDPRSQVIVDAPAAIEALSWLVDAVRVQRIAPESVLDFQEEEARKLFGDGRAVFMRNWPYAWNLLQRERSPVKGLVGIAPMVHGEGRRKSAAVLGGWGYSISAFTEEPEAAWKFVQFMATAESQKVGYEKGGILPTRKVLFNDPQVIAKSPHYRVLYDVLSAARPRPMHPEYPRLSAILQVHLGAALAGKKSPEEALKAAAAEMRAALASPSP